MDHSHLYAAALNKAMALCSKKEYCCEEIRIKLDSWDVRFPDSEKIINALVKERFIDEVRYANAFTRDKFRYNKWGKIKIASQLKYRKIPKEIIKEALDALDYEEYTKLLKNLIDAQRKKIRAKNEYDLRARLMRYALSKGFESSLIYEMLGEQPD
jgi:regulatory protein